jgi:hypothetical protein
LAGGTSPARYQLTFASYNTVVQSCPYTDNHVLQEISQGVTATLTDLETDQVVAQQSFVGTSGPGICPETRTFYNQTEQDIVGQPDPAEFKTWLVQVMVPLGFKP